MLKKEEQRLMIVLRALFNSLVIIVSLILISCDHKKVDSDLPEIFDLFNEISTKSVRIPQLHFKTNEGFLTSLEISGGLDQKSVLPIINLGGFKYLDTLKISHCILKNIPELGLDVHYSLVQLSGVHFESDTSYKVRIDANDFFILNSNLKMISFEDCNIKRLLIIGHKLRNMDVSRVNGMELCILANNNLNSLNLGEDLVLKEVNLHGNDFDSTTRNEIYSSIMKYSPDCTIRW